MKVFVFHVQCRKILAKIWGYINNLLKEFNVKCPHCGSTQISKERWKDVVADGYGLAGDSIYSETGDYVCGECKYTDSASSFKEKTKSST